MTMPTWHRIPTALPTSAETRYISRQTGLVPGECIALHLLLHDHAAHYAHASLADLSQPVMAAVYGLEPAHIASYLAALQSMGALAGDILRRCSYERGWTPIALDLPCDPALERVATAASAPLWAVLAIWICLIIDAHRTDARDRRVTHTIDTLAGLTGIESATVSAILMAMQTEDMLITSGQRMCIDPAAWTRSTAQTQREREAHTRRQADYMRRKRQPASISDPDASIIPDLSSMISGTDIRPEHRAHENDDNDENDVYDKNDEEIDRYKEREKEKTPPPSRVGPLAPVGALSLTAKGKAAETPHFDALWDAYGWREGRRAAMAAWSDLLPELTPELVDWMIRAAREVNACRDTRAQRNPMHLSTWLRRRGWEDRPDLRNRPQPAHQQQPIVTLSTPHTEDEKRRSVLRAAQGKVFQGLPLTDDEKSTIRKADAAQTPKDIKVLTDWASRPELRTILESLIGPERTSFYDHGAATLLPESVCDVGGPGRHSLCPTGMTI